jgi:Ca-activated chloride channel family protein
MMKPFRSLVACAFLLPLFFASQTLASSVAEDKTESPYFVVKSDKGAVDGLPLKETRADVHVSGVIARVKVTQTYANDGKNPLEALYVFPGSTRAAVFAMKMTIGDRTIVAKINKKDQARKIYEKAKAAGKSASLLEQKRPNVFQMNVANIMPGDVIQVEMQYTELLVPENGTYEFVYPAVVGPRFTGEASKSDAKKNKWTASPYSKSGKAASYAWGMDFNIDGGVPITNIESPSHKVKETRDGHATRIELADGEQGGNRDFVLRYQLRGEAIQSGMLLFPGADENFFLTMVQPPKRLSQDQIPQREYVFIMDVSGSMHGFPLNTSKQLMRELAKGLKKTDLFNMVFFAGRSALLSEQSLPATSGNINKALTQFNQMKGGGGTRLLNALHRAMALPTKDDVARTFVIVTDGYISVEPDVFEYIRANLGKANLFSFGIGSSVNRHLIEGMSRVGMGESFVSLNGTEAATNAKKFKNYIENPALTNIKVAFDGFDAYDVEPKAVPDLFAQRPVVVFGKYKGEAKGKIAITGTTGKGSFKQIVRVSDYTPDKNNDALKYLWARHKIAGLADLNRLRRDDARIEKVTNLGLEYSLMTAYTSFVAVDHRVRNDGGKSTTVKQVLPLPQGVSDLAVGNSKTQYLQFSGYGMAGGASMKKRIYRPRPTSPTSLRDAKEEDQESKITPERSPRVRPMVVSAKGSLSIADIVRTLRSKLTQCVRSLVAGTRGVVWFKAVIDARGKITVLRRVKSSLSSSRATKCLESQLRKMTFKTGSGNTSIHFGVRIH